jgi:hypothetical protein
MARSTGRNTRIAPRPVPPRRRLVTVLVAVGVLLVTAVTGALIGYAAGRPSATDSTITELKNAEAARDVQQIADLTTMAREIRDQVTPMLAAMTPDTPAAQKPNAAQIRQWQQTMGQVEAKFENPPSGTTATNVARGGLRNAVQQARLAVDGYAAALSAPAGQRQQWLDVAKRQGALAVTAWSVAATQLDQINIDAGHGHQHVHLDLGQHEGAFTADGTPEGPGK